MEKWVKRWVLMYLFLWKRGLKLGKGYKPPLKGVKGTFFHCINRKKGVGGGCHDFEGQT